MVEKCKHNATLIGCILCASCEQVEFPKKYYVTEGDVYQLDFRVMPYEQLRSENN